MRRWTRALGVTCLLLAMMTARPAVAQPAAVNVDVVSLPVTPLPLGPAAIIEHRITLTNTLAEPRGGLSLQLSAGRASSFDQVIGAAGGTVTLEGSSLSWIGDLAAGASATLIVTTRVADCLGTFDTSTRLNDGRPIVVFDPTGTVGSAHPPAGFALVPPFSASVAAMDIAPPSLVGERFVQVARDGRLLTLQMMLRNHSQTQVDDIFANLMIPASLVPAAENPFVAPTPAAVVYDPTNGTIRWNGSIAAGGEVAITFRATLQGGACQPFVSRQDLLLAASAGGCTRSMTASVLPVPNPPAEPHVVGLDPQFGLWTLRPGIDAAPQTLLCLSQNGAAGIDRGPNGDIWVAGQPSYRLDPSLPQLETLDPAMIGRDADARLNDVAVDRSTSPVTTVFLVSKPDASTDLVRYNPATGDRNELRTGLPHMQRIVIDGTGLIAGVTNTADGTQGEIVLVNPNDPATDRRFGEPALEALDPQLISLAHDGRLIAGISERGPFGPLVTQSILKIDPATGLTTLVAADIGGLVPWPPPLFFPPSVVSLVESASGDVFVGTTTGQLGVVHPTDQPSGALVSTGRSAADLVFAEPHEEPPLPDPIDITVLETVSVGDEVTLLPGLTLDVEERVTVDDTIDTLLSIMLDVTESVTVTDAVDTLLSILLDVVEAVTVDDGVEAVAANTPAGNNVIVRLPNPSGIVGPTILMFEHVLAAGNSLMVTSGDGPPPPQGFRSGEPAVFYDVTTTALFAGATRVCFDLRGVAFSAPRLRVFHFENGLWADRTISVDLAQRTACALVTSLSPFAVFQTADVTAPALAAQFDPSASRVAVVASDTVTGVAGPVSVTPLGSDTLRYDATDAAGNTVSMVASVRTARDKVVRNGAIRRQVTVSVKSVAYNGGRSIAAAPNELTIDWTVGSDGSLERVEQDFSVKRSTGREHLTGKWKRRDGVTRIKGTVLPRKIVLNGLVLIRLMIREGSLVVEW